MPHQGRSTHDSKPSLTGTPPFSCFEGELMDKRRVFPPVAHREQAKKHPLQGQKNFHHGGAV